MLDMAAYYNTDVVKEGTAFNVKEIDEVAKNRASKSAKATSFSSIPAGPA